jgi:nucleotide sugar dehydrogenase
MRVSADPHPRRSDERAIRVVQLDPGTATFIDTIHQASGAAPTVAVVGLGYVGLPTSLALLDGGARVIGVDIDPDRVVAIREQRADLIPADRRRLASALQGSDFVMTAEPGAIALADAVIVCVPTPVDDARTPNLDALRSAAATVVEQAAVGQLIVLTSTSHVGTTRELFSGPLEERGFTIGRDIFVAFSPERIDPGNLTFAQASVPRVVGGVTAECTHRAAELIGRIAPVHRVSSAEVAELSKLYENSFRAVNIALANEVESVSQQLGLDPAEVLDAAATKPFGFMPFTPGIGVGGHCIPCDPHYLLAALPDGRSSAPLIGQAMAEIAARPQAIVDRTAERLAAAGRSLREARVLVVGVAYKAGVEDVRESPALEVLSILRGAGALAGYVDGLVPSVRLDDGAILRSIDAPASQAWDAVIVHAPQQEDDLDWLADVDLLVDPGGHVRRSKAAHLRAVAPVA